MTVTFVENPAGIQALVVPGGVVWRFARRIGRDVTRLAIVGAPHRTGALVKRIDAPEMRTLPLTVIATVRSEARHSLWVHEGTRTPITRPGGGVMPVHNASRTRVVVFAERVRGQRANPFLRRALQQSFARHVGR